MDNFAKMDRRVKRYFTLNNQDKRIKKSLFNKKKTTRTCKVLGQWYRVCTVSEFNFLSDNKLHLSIIEKLRENYFLHACYGKTDFTAVKFFL